MEKLFSDTIEKYPNSDLFKYGDWIEFFLRFESGKGCFKISGTQDQVMNSINRIIEGLKKD